MTKKLPLAAIRIDADTQSRVAIDEATVAEYADAMRHGARFPALDVFFDGVAYWLADGFHRFHAAKRAGQAIVDAEYREGTAADARWHAAGSNAVHGLRRTNEDKRRAVTMALACQPEASDRAIAEHCRVSADLVASVRAAQVQETTPAAPTAQPAKRTGKDGKAYTLPVKTPPPPPMPSMPPKPADASAATPDAPVGTRLYKDCVGRAIPADFNAVWEGREELTTIADGLHDLRLQLEAGHAEGDKCLQRVGATVLAMMQKVEGEVREAMPYALCPVCQGVGCKLCRQTGFLGKHIYDNACPDKYKEVAP